ncbi:amidohydrolase family protein [Mesonia sp. MT50]|uniref:Amidohydrolase family protein n=1 Tax=Mesonia profundi TaxID=3070998 RepID=A0ABU1A384_9FLAO|nr:amidohydrolase family protein [Mesonia profundi]MDQ7917398.1 amidohydrolase family protein [Mesonia profundi]
MGKPRIFESHIHLDKACILDRCNIEEGTLEEAVNETSKAKKDFTEEDVYKRASQVVEMAIKKGTMGMRTFVETDPKTSLRAFNAIKKVKENYAFAIDIQICAFAQEGLTDSKETQALLEEALQNGATVVGGCPYKDENLNKHIEMILDLAQKYAIDADFHLDFDLNPEDSNSSIPKLVEETLKRNYQGKVSIGHVTKLAAMRPEQREKMISLLESANINLSILPATDIFLNGRNTGNPKPRGLVNAKDFAKRINTCIASNNILNAFTPYGDASLLRMANMYANLSQAATKEELETVYKMIGQNAAQMLQQNFALEENRPANLVIVEAKNATDAIRKISQPLLGIKNGKVSFKNEAAILFIP